MKHQEDLFLVQSVISCFMATGICIAINGELTDWYFINVINVIIRQNTNISCQGIYPHILQINHLPVMNVGRGINQIIH